MSRLGEGASDWTREGWVCISIRHLDGALQDTIWNLGADQNRRSRDILHKRVGGWKENGKLQVLSSNYKAAPF